MRSYEFITEITRRNLLKGVGAAAIAPVAYNAIKSRDTPVTSKSVSGTIDVEPEDDTSKKDTTVQKVVKLMTTKPLEKYIHDYAVQHGIHGVELAAFMAQIGHESWDFTKLVEKGDTARFNNMDPQFNKKNADELGNKYPGDGYTFRGRGFIQLTGRYNYMIAGKALKLPLEQNPDLAADVEIAAKLAVFYWKTRVRTKVTDFSNTSKVTYPINKKLKGLDDRVRRFKEYMKSLG